MSKFLVDDLGKGTEMTALKSGSESGYCPSLTEGQECGQRMCMVDEGWWIAETRWERMLLVSRRAP